MRTLSSLWVAALLTALGPAASSALQFTHGVASGEVTPFSVVLWTRTDGAAVLQVEVERISPGPGPKQVKRVALAKASSDFTARVLVLPLLPDATYRYKFRSGGTTSDVGTFRTAPLPTVARSVRFAFSGDSDGTKVGGVPFFNQFESLDAAAQRSARLLRLPRRRDLLGLGPAAHGAGHDAPGVPRRLQGEPRPPGPAQPAGRHLRLRHLGRSRGAKRLRRPDGGPGALRRGPARVPRVSAHVGRAAAARPDLRGPPPLPGVSVGQRGRRDPDRRALVPKRRRRCRLPDADRPRPGADAARAPCARPSASPLRRRRAVSTPSTIRRAPCSARCRRSCSSWC